MKKETMKSIGKIVNNCNNTIMLKNLHVKTEEELNIPVSKEEHRKNLLCKCN